jgi:hypothetical protein
VACAEWLSAFSLLIPRHYSIAFTNRRSPDAQRQTINLLHLDPLCRLHQRSTPRAHQLDEQSTYPLRNNFITTFLTHNPAWRRRQTPQAPRTTLRGPRVPHGAEEIGAEEGVEADLLGSEKGKNTILVDAEEEGIKPVVAGGAVGTETAQKIVVNGLKRGA